MTRALLWIALTLLLAPPSLAARSPYPTGLPHAVPGLIEAENFDDGGAEVGYHDSDAINEGAALRSGEGVDIGAMPGGNYYVGWNKAGEWLLYSVAVSESGLYQLSLLVSDDVDSGGTLHFDLDGTLLAGPINIVPTGSWANYTTVTAQNVYLHAGAHTLRMSFDTQLTYGQGNIDHFSFTRIQTLDSLTADFAPAPQSQVLAGADRVPLGTLELTNPGTLELSVTSLLLAVQDRTGQACAWDDVFASLELRQDAAVVGTLSPPFASNGLFLFSPALAVPGQGRLRLDLIGRILDSPRVREFVLAVPTSQSINGGQIFLEPVPGKSLPLTAGQINVRTAALTDSFSTYPNPFRAGSQSAALVYYVGQPARVTLTVFTLTGEQVRALQAADVGPGMQTLSWDGTNDLGLGVKSGVYVVHLRIRNSDGSWQESKRKIAVAR